MGDVPRWYYATDTKETKGPFREELLTSLASKGIIKPNSLVWNSSMDSWKPFVNVCEFRSFGNLLQTSWHYIKDSKTIGNIPTRELHSLFQNGTISSKTLLWSSGMSGWQELEHVPELYTYLKETLDKEVQLSTTLAGVKTMEYPESTLDPSYNGEDSGIFLNKDNHDTKSASTVVSNYNSNDTTKNKKTSKRKWKAAKENTWVYVEGLPSTTTVDELHEVFKKFGLVQVDIHTGDPRIKLYTTDNGLSGDASICYLKKESVELAIMLLNEAEFRPGVRVKVSQATFSKKDNELVERKKVKLSEQAKLRKRKQEQMLSWSDEPENVTHNRIVVLRNLQLKSLDENSIRTALSAIELHCANVGAIEKSTYFQDHHGGIVVIKFMNSSNAAMGVDHLAGFEYNGCKLDAALWEGEDFSDKRKANEIIPNEEKNFEEWLNEGSSDEEEVHAVPLMPQRTLPDISDDSD